MSSVIFSGNYVKTLKAGLNLFNNATIWSGNIDPSSTGFAANIGDVYISTLTASLYIKETSGNTGWAQASTVGTNWKAPVTNAAALPASGNTSGDVAVTLDTGNLWEWNGSSWEIVAGPNVLLSVGSIDSHLPSSDGAVDVNNSLVLQSASASVPGLINNTSQTISGQKTFSTGLTGTLTGHATLDVPLTEVGAANGVASLDSGGKVPVAQLPNTVMEYQGNWDPSTNTPTLADGTGTPGNVYRISVAFAGTISGLTDPSMVNFQIGEWVIYSSSVSKWQKSPISDGVISVNGAQGVVTVNAINQLTGDGTAGPASQSQSQAFTLATVNSNIGSFGSSSAIPAFTVNGKGLITAASTNSVVAPAGTLTGTTLASNVVSSSLTSVGTITSGTWNGTTIDITHGGTNSNTALNNNQLIWSNSGKIVEAGALTNGQLFIGSSGAAPVASAISAGTGINISNGAGSITITNTQSSGTDIPPTSFSASNNQASPSNITGLSFSNSTVRSFTAYVSTTVIATSNLYEYFTISGIQRGSDWQISSTSTADISGFIFSITTAGQLQYTSSTYPGFVSATLKFRAITLST